VALTDNLISAWELDEASGDAIDAHNISCGGSGCDLSDGNTVGSSGGWRDFESTATEFFERADHADLSMVNSDFTFELWVNLESKAGSGDANCLLAKGDELLVLYDNGILATDRFLFRIYDGTTFTTVVANNFGSPSITTDYQLICQYDATADEVSIKINDGAADTNSHANGVQDSAEAFRLGLAAGNFFPFDGLMRRTRIWKRKLTGAELTWLYNSGNSRSYADIVAGMAEEGGTPFAGFIGAYRLN
jgi:hypothetical protein